MAFKGITFAGQNVTPKNDGGLYQAHHGDGILWGCSMNISGDDLVIQSGEFIMGGRVVQVDGATSVDLSGRTLQTGYIQVIMNADLSQGEGSQWYTTFVESATTTFPALTKDDINDTGTLYQLGLAVMQVGGGNLTNIIGVLANSSVVSKGNFYLNDEGIDGRSIYYRQNGTLVSKIEQQSGGAFITATTDADGNSLCGLDCTESGNTVVFCPAGQSVILRPNGIGSSIGQVSLSNNGQFVGGATVLHNKKTTSTSITSPTGWTTAVSLTGLVASGLYCVWGYCVYKPNSSSTHYPWFRINGYPENRVSVGNTSYPVYVSRYVTGTTSISFDVSPQASAITGATIDANAEIWAMRIA